MKKDKYLQIFNYLKEFSELRSKSVRNIEKDSQYPEMIWLDEIPSDDLFENIIREDFNADNDYWIKIRKPTAPKKPIMSPVPHKIREWIIEETILDDEGPILYEKIIRDGEELFSKDSPEIIEEYEKYLYEKWIDDSDLYNEQLDEYNSLKKVYDKVDEMYKHFFRIYNKAQQFGEEYELIIGIGLLNYHANDDSPKIRRHIFTQRVDIEFEFSKSNSMLIIRPNLESSPIIETDFIIDLPNQLNSQNIIDAEKEVKIYLEKNEIYHIFMKDYLSDAIQMFADRFSADGIFKNSLEKPNRFSKIPELLISPALALRKRNTRSFTSLFNSIIEEIGNVNEDINIPSLNTLIEEDISKDDDSIIDLNENNQGNLDAVKRVYFPLEYNKEQEDIIYSALSKKKVLVQGPPGTGKSHTIANLMCHLLASGNKILVTAYTKRALEVLKEKLPEEFRGLTVNLLSGDSESIQGLQYSVNAINEKLSDFSQTNYSAEISELDRLLNETRENIAINTNELIKIKEKDFRQLEINSNYSGTLLSVTKKVSEDKITYGWYKDQFSSTETKYLVDRVLSFVVKNKYYSTQDINELEMELPEVINLPTIEELISYKNSYDYCYKFKSGHDFQTEKISCGGCKEILQCINEIYLVLEKAFNIEIFCRENIINSYSQNNSKIWDEKIQVTAELIASLEHINIREFERTYEIKYESDISLKQLKSDTIFWSQYIKKGNSISGIGFNIKKRMLPREYKEKMYLLEDLRINGSLCDTKSELEILIKYLQIQQVLEELDSIWQIDKGRELNSGRIVFYKNLLENGKLLLNYLKEIQVVVTKVHNESNLRITNYSLENFKNLKTRLKFHMCKNESAEFENRINSLSRDFNRLYYHHKIANLVKILENKNFEGYRDLLVELKDLQKAQDEYKDYCSLYNEINGKLPLLVVDINNRNLDDHQLRELKSAILFRHAQIEIKKLMDSDYEEQIYRELKNYHKKEKKLIAELASKKAWVYVVERLKDDTYLKRNLVAWVLAVSKIGKTGKGKRALKFRKEAQVLMEKCKTSVPCWVMPLYKIAETIKPEYQMYDYVIIDEASQLGPDAIFLLYIAKRIIIVGDDKQTSPEYVGIKADSMKPHIDRYLQGIPFKQHYGTEFSFFDHARLFCDKSIFLREHFRCMPEIIEFSNRYFYKPENKSLYPLKQFSDKRLEPLKHIYCGNGYTEGRGSRIINRVEANKIADIIGDMVEDLKYNGKTIGVITLQGKQQANLIESEILKNIGETKYHNHKIVCGESASFQGDERDIIFLSLVTATNHNRSALTKPEDERRFNVAASRAKEQAWLIHSIQLEDLSNQNDMRYKILEHYLNYKDLPLVSENVIERKKGNQPEPFDSWFEIDVHNDIVLKGYKVIPQYSVAKGRYRIDLVVILNNGTRIAVECDGDKFHGPEQFRNDILRQNDLERCGWQFFRVRGCIYYADRVKSLVPLWELLEENDSSLSENEKIIVNDIISSESKDDNVQDKSSEESHKLEDKPLRYLNIYMNGDYVLTEDKSIESEYCISIFNYQKNGFLMQCYESGHINKVYVDTLLRKRINKKYMNGLNRESKLLKMEIILEDAVVGISFTEDGIDKFKAHLTEKISTREQLQLKGIKVIYKEFCNIQYYFISNESAKEIEKLIFSSFIASGKAFSNKYYSLEWKCLRNIGIFG